MNLVSAKPGTLILGALLAAALPAGLSAQAQTDPTIVAPAEVEIP